MRAPNQLGAQSISKSFARKTWAIQAGKAGLYSEKTRGSGKNLLISINKPAVIVNQTRATTGAVDK